MENWVSLSFSGPPGPSESSPGPGPAPKTARSRTRARTARGIDFWAKLYYQKLLGMKNWVGLRFFRTGSSGSRPGPGPAPKTARSRTRARTARGIDFWAKNVSAKAVGNKELGWFKVFPVLQDYLGQVPGQVQLQRQPGVGREQGQPKVFISGQSCIIQSCWE